MSTDNLPCHIEAEKTILGSILIDSNVFPQVGRLRDEDFFLDQHRRIFRSMRELAEENHPIDPITLTDQLERNHDMSSVGGMAYLSTLSDGIPLRPKIVRYVEIVREKALSRRLVAIGEAVAERARNNMPLAENLSTLEQDLMDVESDRHGSHTYHISEFMAETIAMLKQEAENNGLVGLTTGVGQLDYETTGIRPEELWLIGGLSNSGKTPLGTQIAYDNAVNGVPVKIFSLEMSRFRMASRILAASATIEASKVRRPKFITTSEWVHAYEGEAQLSKLPIWVNDASTITISELLMQAKLSIRQQGVKLIIVDYLMLVDAPGKQLREQADAITRGLRALAKSERVSVVLLSQFKRPANINDRPNLTWFKESGGIENNAHVALAVHRPVSDDGVSPTGEDEIIIVKNREGTKGPINTHFDIKTLRFRDRE